MRWSLTIGRIGGTAVRIHVTFLLLLAWIGFSAWRQGGASAAMQSLVFILLLFACVVLHEFGHIFAARRYGIATSDVTLLPIGGVASLQRMPTQPSQELIVALAGPAVNVVIGVALLLVLGGVQPDALEHLDDNKVSLLARLASANLFLAVFNLIPAFPMDGGRVLHALLAMRVGGPRATQLAAQVGQALAFVLGFLGLFGNPMLLFVAIFVYVAAAAEAQSSSLHESAKGLTVADAMETQFMTIPIDAPLSQAVETLIASAQHEFPVVDAFRKPAGLLTRSEILAALSGKDGSQPAAELITGPAQTVRDTLPLEKAMERMEAPGGGAVCVVDADGAIAGLLPRQAIAEVLMIRSLRPDWRFRATA